jgi:hypothetical protein
MDFLQREFDDLRVFLNSGHDVHIFINEDVWEIQII